MLKKLPCSSFCAGLILVGLLTFALGAAANKSIESHRYDVSAMIGGVLHITDHNTDTIYVYRREKEKKMVTYELLESIDLSRTGEERIPAQTIAK